MVPRLRLLAPRTTDRRALNQAHDATACKKQGFFVAGFETPGEYVALHDEYIPLSRAICCRPCVQNDDRVSVAALAAITGAEKENFTADDIVVVSAECRGSTRGAPSTRPAARAASGVAADGPTCPANMFVQGFAEDVRANPSSASGDQYYYPTGGARCCAPRLLLRSGEAIATERCECTRQTSQYAVGCGAANTPESAQKAGALIYAFENEVSAETTAGNVVQVPVTPLSCCKVCVSPNARPGTETCASLDFCNARGACDANGRCACDAGYAGDACETALVEGGSASPTVTTANLMKIAAAFVVGGLAWFPAARFFGWDRRHRGAADDLEEELLGAERRERVDDWEFEASDLSTSDEEDSGPEAATRDAISCEGEAEVAADAAGEAAGEPAGEAIAGARGSLGDASDPREPPAEMREDEAHDTAAPPAEKPAEVADSGKGKSDGGGFSSECNVCMSAPVQVVLIPCGHACMCRKCSRRMRRCPVCRTEVERRQKLYLAAE